MFNKKILKVFISVLFILFVSCKTDLSQSVRILNNTSKIAQIISINGENESIPVEIQPSNSYVFDFANLQESLTINLNIDNEKYVIYTDYIQEKNKVTLVLSEENGQYDCTIKTKSSSSLCELKKY